MSTAPKATGSPSETADAQDAPGPALNGESVLGRFSRPVDDPCCDCGRVYTYAERVQWLVLDGRGGSRVAWEGCVDCWVRKTTVPPSVECEWWHADDYPTSIVRVCLRWSACWHFYRWSPMCAEHLLVRINEGGSAGTATECPECRTISPLTVANVEAVRGLHV